MIQGCKAAGIGLNWLRDDVQFNPSPMTVRVRRGEIYKIFSGAT